MKINPFVYVIALCFFLLNAHAQVSCGTDEQLNYLLKTQPAFARMYAKNARQQRSLTLQPYSGIPDTINVVVHVLHLGGQIGTYNNPSDAAVRKMIATLNSTFNASYSDPDSLNYRLGVDIGIYFRLAERDSFCRPVTGITRHDMSQNSTYCSYGVSVAGSPGISQEDVVKVAYWDNTKYMNVWLVDKVANGIYAGVAFFPTGGKTINDGLFLAYYCVNTNTIAHETGHYLGLNHTFAGSVGTECPPSTGNCKMDNDKLCDTDPHPQNTQGCAVDKINPCTGRPYGNIVYNHMSYSCPTIFTPDQRDFMRSTMKSFRSSLLAKDACPAFTYTFTGSGDWRDSSNWSNHVAPPPVLPDKTNIVINGVGQSILSTSQLMLYQNAITIKQGKQLVIRGQASFTNHSGNSSGKGSLTPDALTTLDSLSVPTPKTDGLKATGTIASGRAAALTAGDPLTPFITNLLNQAALLAGQKNIVHPAEGNNRPQQLGYAYRYGGFADNKDLSVRRNADNGDALHNGQMVFGTDCTGFLLNILRGAGLTIPTCDIEHFEAVLRYAFSADQLYQNVRLENIGLIAETQFKSADFIQWPGHNGLVYHSPGQNSIMFNSNGNPFPQTIQSWKDRTRGIKFTAAEEQANNLGADRGIHAVDLHAAIAGGGYWGSGYQILRMESVAVTTDPLRLIQGTGATAGGSLDYRGAGQQTQCGFVISSDPSFTNSRTVPTGVSKFFAANLTGLQEGANYWVKAYTSITGPASLGQTTYYGNIVSFTAGQSEDKKLKIGDEHEGGIIFYLDQSGKHGLICAKYDVDASPWDVTVFDASQYQLYSPVFVGNTSTSILTGAQNTTSIENRIGMSLHAAAACTRYTYDGFNDWYLPSKDELNLMYINLHKAGLGGFTTLNSGFYWSSSEISSNAAWCQKFEDGSLVDYAWKNNAMNVRPVRIF